jgi:hypothetical protein
VRLVIPAIKAKKMRGATTILINLKKMVPNIFKSAADCPNHSPAAIPTTSANATCCHIVRPKHFHSVVDAYAMRDTPRK